MKTLLALIVTPSMEQPLTDWLLMNPEVEGFTSHQAFGHGGHHALTLTEQVTGRRKQMLFWLELEQERVERIVSELKRDFHGGQIHYWLVPLTDSGVID